jgi:hypothetical protein
MNIRFGLRENRTQFRPGEEVTGAVQWEGTEKPKLAEVRLFWFTRGKGTEDVEVIAADSFGDPQPGDTRTFRFVLPDGPYSFNGKLISLTWAVEFVLKPGDHAERIEIVVSPIGEEIRLSQIVKPGANSPQIAKM